MIEPYLDPPPSEWKEDCLLSRERGQRGPWLLVLVLANLALTGVVGTVRALGS
jgi:hypothetical protein